MATSPGSFIAREDGREKEMDGGGVLGVLRGKQRVWEGLVGGSRESGRGGGGGGGWWRNSPTRGACNPRQDCK